MPLYIPTGSQPPAADEEDVQRCRSLLRSARDSILGALAADPNAMLEAKGWLATTLAAAPDPPVAARAACLLPRPARQPHCAATATGLNASAQRQLLQLLSEQRPAEVWRQLRSSCPQLLPDFFAASDTRIKGWFCHFDMGGIGAFTYGAKALANYAWAERDHAWQHLVWTGKHAQAPVAVAAKPHYFCELDVVATVRRLLRECPGFWRSEELARSCEGGAHLALDYAFFVEELSHMLQQGRSSEREPLLDLLHSIVQQSDWRPMCERLLPFMGEPELLRVVNSLRQQGQQGQQQRKQQQQQQRQGQQSSQGALAAWANATSSCVARDLSPLLLSDVVFEGAREAVLANALGCHRGELWRLLQQQGKEAGEQEEEGAQQLAALVRTVGQLHGQGGCSEAAHLGLLASLGDAASVRRRTLLLLEFWTLRAHLLQTAATNPSTLEALLQQLGAQYQLLQPGTPPGADTTASPAQLPRGGKAGPSGRDGNGHAGSYAHDGSDMKRHHPNSSGKRRHTRRLTEKQPGSKQKKKGHHKKHKKRRRRRSSVESDADGSSGSSLLDPGDFPSSSTGKRRKYDLLPSDSEDAAVESDEDPESDSAALLQRAEALAQAAAGGVAAALVAGPSTELLQEEHGLDWSVRLPGWQDSFVGSAVDVADALACYCCQRWVQRLVSGCNNAHAPSSNR